MSYNMLRELSIGHQHYTVKVRITRIWDSINPFIGNNHLMSVDFLAVDEEGTCVQGTMRPHDSTNIKRVLHEGHIYELTKFTVIPARKSYKAIDCDRFIHLAPMTTIKKLNNSVDNIPDHIFKCFEYSDLRSRAYNDDCLTDVIGVLIKIGRTNTVYVREKPTKKRDLIIHNESGQLLKVTLWGDHANQINHDEVLATANPVVLTLPAMTVRQYRGEVCINSTSASRCYIDLDIPEVNYFRNKLPPRDYKVELLPEELQPLTPDEEKQQNRKTIEELLRLDPFSSQDMRFTCVATLKEINCTQGWWYPACPICFYGVKIEDTQASCNNHGPLNQPPIPWYKIDVVVEDSTALTNFTIFGRLAQQIVQVPAAVLTAQPDSDRYIPPNELRNLIGHIYIFQIAFNLRRGRSFGVSFKVTKIFDYKKDQLCQQTSAPPDQEISSPARDHYTSRIDLTKESDIDLSNEDILNTPIPSQIQQELFASEESLIPTPPAVGNIPIATNEGATSSKKRTTKKELLSDRATKRSL